MEELKSRNLEELASDELVIMWSYGEITALELVENAWDVYTDWEEWLQDNRRERGEQAAGEYLEWFDRQAEENM